MKTRNLLTILILFLTVLTSTVKTYADDAEQTILLSVPATVAITKRDSSIDTTTVNPSTGTMERALQTIYDITTNGNDDDYDFTITSVMTTADGDVSAYGNGGCLLFAHTINPPTTSAVNNAKSGGNNNRNVVAYPTSATITTPMTAEFEESYGVYGPCYVIKTKDALSGTLTHSVLTSPVSGTYNAGQDEAGTYKATIIITVTPKS